MPQTRDLFDRLLVNPKRGPWDMYLKAWPVIVLALAVAGAVSPHPAASAADYGNSTIPAVYGTAHQCWEAADRSINGCRLSNGTVIGVASGSPTTCYFYEPLAETATSLTCDPD